MSALSSILQVEDALTLCSNGVDIEVDGGARLGAGRLAKL